MLSVFHIKLVAIPVLLVAKGLAGFVPYCLLQSRKNPRGLGNAAYLNPRGKLSLFLAWANCFAAGVFLATCFVGLLPSVEKKYHRFMTLFHGQNISQSLAKQHDYPLPEASICIGFFLVWGLELLIHGCVSWCQRRGKSNPFDTTGPSNYGSLSKDHSVSKRHSTSSTISLAPNKESDSHEKGGSQCEHESVPHENEPSSGLLTSILLTAALSAHTTLEGIGFGLLDSLNQVVNMLLAMLIHECLCSLALGINLAKCPGTSRAAALWMLAVYSVLEPLGIVIGLLIDARADASIEGQLAAMLMQGIAAGTFLYVVFMEVLPKEFCPEKASHSHHIDTTGTTDVSHDTATSAGTSEINGVESVQTLSPLIEAPFWKMLFCLFGFIIIALLRTYH